MRVQVGDVKLWFDVVGPTLEIDDTFAHSPAILSMESVGMRERPTLLLLHGGPGFDHTLFRPAYDDLADVAQLVYLDHRGNGRSDRGDPSRWTLGVWADDVRAFCDVLGIERPIVLGWSFGGMVALAYAARHPDHPSKLIFQSTMGRLDIESIAEGFRRAGGDEASDIALKYWSGAGDLETLLAYGATCTPLYSRTPADPAEIGRCELNVDLLLDPGACMRGMDLLSGLSVVRSPTLVLAGEDDPITSIDAMQDVVDALPKEHVRFERFANAGHNLARDEPERFFGVLRDFIRS